MCVRKQEHKCTPVTVQVEKSESSSNCVIENILQYHKMMTLDLENNLEDEYWENKFNSDIQWYNIFYCSLITFKIDLKNFHFSENNKSNENIDEDDEENKIPLPPYIQMVLSIMKRVLHYLPSKHNSLPLQVFYSY